MPKLIYSMGVSLDGYTAGPGGDIGWSAPDEELHRFHNEQTRQLGAQIMGRGLYEAMLPWETTEDDPSATELLVEFARIWKPIPKVVFSTTLQSVEGNASLARDDLATEQPGDSVISRRLRPGRGLRATRADRRVLAVRQPGHPRRRHALLPGSG